MLTPNYDNMSKEEVLRDLLCLKRKFFEMIDKNREEVTKVNRDKFDLKCKIHTLELKEQSLTMEVTAYKLALDRVSAQRDEAKSESVRIKNRNIFRRIFNF